MKTALIHFSDFHISSVEDFVVTHINQIAAACRPLTNLCEKIFIIITGDIIDKGSVAAYQYAESALRELKSEIEKENPTSDIQFIIVPGNHDNNYECPQAIVRSAIINGIKDPDKVNEELLPICLDPQADFWKFYSQITEEEQKPSVSSVRNVQLDETHQLKIVSYNTSVCLILKKVDTFSNTKMSTSCIREKVIGSHRKNESLLCENLRKAVCH